MDDMQKICLFLFCFKQIQLVHDMNALRYISIFYSLCYLKNCKNKNSILLYFPVVWPDCPFKINHDSHHFSIRKTIEDR